MDIGLALFWTGPIGIGVFLFGLGVLFMGIAKVCSHLPSRLFA